MGRLGLIARLPIHLQDQAGIGHEIAGIGRGRTPWLAGVITPFGTLLMTVEGLDGDLDVQDPQAAQ